VLVLVAAAAATTRASAAAGADKRAGELLIEQVFFSSVTKTFRRSIIYGLLWVFVQIFRYLSHNHWRKGVYNAQKRGCIACK